MKTFCESDICSDLLKDLINSFNNNLSTTLAGASVANLAARLIASDLVVMKLRDTFLGMVQTQLLDNQPNLQVQSVNIYFSRLFTIMNNHLLFCCFSTLLPNGVVWSRFNAVQFDPPSIH